MGEGTSPALWILARCLGSRWDIDERVDAVLQECVQLLV